MIGETIGSFEIVARLGKGGMGEVWLAEHQTVHTQVAIKILDDEISNDREQVDRFFNQALAAGRIRHPGIGKMFDVGFHQGRAFLIMEYLEGDTLRRRIRTGPLATGRAVELGKQIASVLAATHEAGVIHRDLKPENIILVRDPSVRGGERARLVDFGIAKLADVSLTSTSGAMLGTPAYMSPEQWRNVTKVDARSDTYSLGCTLFELLCGRPPFVATSIGEACSQHLTDPPPSLRGLVPGVPEACERLVMQMLDKDPANRPAMADVERALAALAEDHPIEAIVPSPSVDMMVSVTRATQATQATQAPIPPPPPVIAERRSRVPIYLGLGVVAVAGIGIAVMARSSNPPVVLPPDAAVPVAAPIDAAPRVAVDPPDSVHTLQNTSGLFGEREFVSWKKIPPRIAGEDPKIPRHAGTRICFVRETGVVARVAVDSVTARDHAELVPVIRDTILAWRFAPGYQSAKTWPLVCFALDLKATVSKAEFAAWQRGERL